MLQFNIYFLLKATTVTALCCLPMAFSSEIGFVWTTFLLPASVACLAASQVRRHAQFEFRLKEQSDSVVEIDATGGRYNQWLKRCRIVIAGGCLSVAFGFPMLHIVDPNRLQCGFHWLCCLLLVASWLPAIQPSEEC